MSEKDIFDKLWFYLWSPSGENGRFQPNFDFGTNLTCDTVFDEIKVSNNLVFTTMKFNITYIYS